jgi:hypothetical protein
MDHLSHWTLASWVTWKGGFHSAAIASISSSHFLSTVSAITTVSAG